MQEYSVIKIGHPYSTLRRIWDERADFAVRSGQHIFVQTAKGLSTKDIRNFSSGRFNFGILPAGPIFFVVFSIDGFCGWSDISYWQGAIPEQERDLPQAPGDMALMNCILVNADTGIVEALRAITLSRHTTELLHRLIRRQLDNLGETGQNDVAQAIRNTYARYQTSAQMARDCMVMERAGAKRF